MKKYIQLIAISFLMMFSINARGQDIINVASINLLKESFKIDPKNTVISGLSVDFATDMLANGATGKSLNELTKFFGNSVEDKNNELTEKLKNLPKTIEISNSIWGNKFRKSYETLLKNILGVYVESLPKNTDVINKWISQKTHGKIPSVLKPESTDAHDLYLVNTVYFKDTWISQFNKDNTREEIFYSLSGQNKNTPMMNLSTRILYAENDKFQSIKLPYKNGGYMIIFLPKKDVDFKEFINTLSENGLNADYLSRKVNLSLPRFKIDKETNIKELFKILGIRKIFDKNNNDLTNISENGVYIQNIKQRALIEIDEEGTTAVGATVVRGRTRGSGPIPFIVNRPFLFYITQGDFIGVYTGDK